jgi:hypothetical protein
MRRRIGAPSEQFSFAKEELETVKDSQKAMQQRIEITQDHFRVVRDPPAIKGIGHPQQGPTWLRLKAVFTGLVLFGSISIPEAGPYIKKPGG